MKLFRIIPSSSVLMLCIFLAGCASSDDEDSTVGNWTRVTPFKGVKRSGAVSFTIGTRVFVALGYDGDEYLNDMYVFDIDKGYWESVGELPETFTLRERAVAFSVDGKGYVGLGYNRDLDDEELGDFWEYDPASDSWKQLADFAGGVRYNAIAFSIGSKGYVGTGNDGDNTNSDFWEFDPATGAWTEIVSYPGEKIESGLAFVINGKAYIGTGIDNGLSSPDFWEFTPAAGDGAAAWTKRSPDDDEADYDEFKSAMYRRDAVALTLGNKAYIVGGIASSGATDKSVYEFDVTTFNWDDRTSFEGSARSLAVAFTLQNRLFVGTGMNGSSRFDDVWEFKPNEEYDENY